MSDWLRLKVASKYSNYHIERIRELIRQKRIKARKVKVITVWEVSRKSLDAYINEQKSRGQKRGPKPKGRRLDKV